MRDTSRPQESNPLVVRRFVTHSRTTSSIRQAHAVQPIAATGEAAKSERMDYSGVDGRLEEEVQVGAGNGVEGLHENPGREAGVDAAPGVQWLPVAGPPSG